ncbi:MAG: hypothetical protein GC153_07810 [Alphaproteobacteria bacterium]|nr:hypothetical protein [Alphaproteobacteria bacterium]
MSDTAISGWTHEFKSPSMEREFCASIRAQSLKNNTVALMIAAPFYAVYSILDLLILDHPITGAAIRLGTALICGLIILLFCVKSLARFHERLSVLAVLVLGFGIDLIIWQEPTLDNSYYVALIQGGVFVSFLLRLSFVNSLIVLGGMYLGFIVAVVNKSPPREVVLQCFIVFSMYCMCAFGIYMLQALRRQDFLKSRTIAQQNAQLAAMLADAQLDNERKLAALNTLIHFVKTPIHQIVGFTDLIVRGLNEASGADAAQQLEHASFVKKASSDLADNVAKLLAYYRLDEQVKGMRPETVELAAMLDDFKDLIEEKAACTIERRPPVLVNYAEPIRVALSSLASVCMDESSAITEVLVEWRERAQGGLDVSFIYDGSPLSDERFADLTQPLTKITNYLTADGLAMPMALRTVARAAEICHGRLEYRRAGDRNVLILSLADLSEEALSDRAKSVA